MLDIADGIERKKPTESIPQVSTAVTMKNAVFWNIKCQFFRQRKHITSPLQSTAG
jgi:hypothetical protein